MTASTDSSGIGSFPLSPLSIRAQGRRTTSVSSKDLTIAGLIGALHIGLSAESAVISKGASRYSLALR